MFATAYEFQNLGLDQWPFLHHLGIARPNHEIATDDERAVASTIVLELMPPLAVQFEHESVSDQEIDTSDSGDDDLCPDADPKPSERQSSNRLEAGLAPTVAQLPETTAPWRRRTDGRHVARAQEAPVQG
jgi:hypothetical protein